MHVQTTLTHAAHLAEIAHRALCEMSRDQNAWAPIQSAGKVSDFVDAGIQLKAAYTTLRVIAAAIAAQAAELAALTDTAHCGHCGAAVIDAAAHQCAAPDEAPFADRVARALRDPSAAPPQDAAGITTTLADEVEQIIGIIARLQADPDYTRALGAHHRQSPPLVFNSVGALQAVLADLRQVAATLAAPAEPAAKVQP